MISNIISWVNIYHVIPTSPTYCLASARLPRGQRSDPTSTLLKLYASSNSGPRHLKQDPRNLREPWEVFVISKGSPQLLGSIETADAHAPPPSCTFFAYIMQAPDATTLDTELQLTKKYSLAFSGSTFPYVDVKYFL